MNQRIQRLACVTNVTAGNTRPHHAAVLTADAPSAT